MHQPHITHHIQLGIIRQMLKNNESRYSDLKPKTIESNLFMYHLKQLIREGLIEKQDKMYVLSREGKRFADRATLETMKVRIQPKIVVVLCVRREDGKWLIMRRKHQPFVNFHGFPSGKMHFGETLQAAAERELREKANLHDVTLTLQGNVVMRFTEAGEIVNHIIGYIFTGSIPVTTEVDLDSEHFHTFIGDESRLFEEPSFKGHHEICALLRSDNSELFVREYEFVSDY